MLLDSNLLLDMLFDRMPMVVAVLDRQFRLVRLNPTWAEFAVRFSPSSPADVFPGAYYFDIFPGSEGMIRPLFEQVLAGETVWQEAVRLETGDHVSFWDVVLEPILEAGEVVGILNVGIDATKREETVSALREREERLELVLRGTNDGIWDWNLETDEVYYSPRWKSMLGYEEEEIPAHVSSWRQLLHPEDVEKAERALAAHLTGEQSFYEVEHRLRHKDGSYRWILARGAAVRDAEGRARRMVGSHTDVTERRRAEEIQVGQQQFLELLATGGTLSETLDKLLRAIEEQSPGMLGLILLLDEDGRHLHVGAAPSLSPAYLDSVEGLEIGPMVGSCGTASYTGKRVIVTDIAADPRWDNLRDLALGSGLHACWSEPVFSAAGEVVGTFAMYFREPRAPTEKELQIIATGAHLAGIAIERKRADDALRESERRLSTLMSNLPGMAYRSANDRDWSLSFASQGSIELTGYTPEELVGDDPITFAELIHPEDRDAVWAQVQAALASGEPFQLTYRLRTAAGVEKWAWEQGRGIYDERGELVALEGFITDATERVMTRQMLEQRVAERTRELSTLLDMSHEIASTRELEPLLGQVLDQLKAVVDYDGASILVLEQGMLQVRAYRGPIRQEEALQLRFPLAKAGANQAVIERRRPLVIPNVRGEGALAQAFQETAGETLDSTFGYVRSWLGVPLIVKGEILGMLSLDHDEADHYTEQHSRLVLAFADQVAATIENARLYQAAETRADEAQTLFTVQRAITSNRERESILQLIADEARRLTGAARAIVFMLSEEANSALEITVLSGREAGEDHALLGYRLPLETSLTGRALREDRPFRSDDAQNDPRLFKEIVREIGARSLLTVPLRSGESALGALSVLDKAGDRHAFHEEDERVLEMLASGAVIALENARLFEEEQERRQVAEGLRDILSVLNSEVPLPEMMDYLVAQAVRILGADGGIIFRVEHEDEEVVPEAMAGLPPDLQAIGRIPLLDTQANRASLQGKPMIVPDHRAAVAAEAQHLPSLDAETRGWLDRLVEEFGSFMSVPFVVEGEVYGDITLYYRSPRSFSPEELGLAEAFGEQASLAVENARLRTRARASAASEERNRLARELHDAVTQTLFSASLIAEVIPRIWDKNPEQARQRLEELRELTRGALAEMRTLLLELRPATLTESTLPELLRQLRDAVVGRSRLEVALQIEGERELPPEVQVAFYRIAQETLNNVSKHANATKVAVRLHCAPEAISLSIVDDGKGFKMGALSPDSLGIGIMQERAEEIGADLEIESVIGKGTAVRCVWPES